MSSVVRASRIGLIGAVVVLSCSDAAASATDRSPVSGAWQATVSNPSGLRVAFVLEVAPDADDAPSSVRGALVNGPERTTASGGTFDAATAALTLQFDFFDAVLHARVGADGALTGTFERTWEQQTLVREFQAVRAGEAAPAIAAATTREVDLTGDWVLRVGADGQQRLWRAVFATESGRAGGTIIPVSGDWGAFTGTWSAERGLALHHFDGINSRRLDATLQPDGTLRGSVDLGLFEPPRPTVAERLTSANAALVAELPDPARHTRMRDPHEPFRFRLADLDGTTVAWDDARFAGRVVVVSIMGTWCPACHEDGPFWQALYARHRARGLEVVGLAFEYTGATERDRRQLRLFAQRHGITYPLLLGGHTRNAAAQLEQLVNFGVYPTALIIGRDGRVREVHVGFEGGATGERGERRKAGIEARVVELLRE